MKKILSTYGFFGTLRLFWSVTISRLFVSSKVRIIRLPFYIRGHKNIDWGTGFTSGVNLRIDADPQYLRNEVVLRFGKDVQVNDYVHIGAFEKVSIGNQVLIASKVFISDHNHGNYVGEDHSAPDMAPAIRPVYSAPVIIEDNVWIGEHVSVLPGVTIGKGSIIGANSVVNRSIPPYSIAVGAPARVVKTYNFTTLKWELV